MVHANTVKVPTTTARPHVTTYDAGFEHSVEHWMEVRHLVEEAENESTSSPKPTHSHGILAVA